MKASKNVGHKSFQDNTFSPNGNSDKAGSQVTSQPPEISLQLIVKSQIDNNRKPIQIAWPDKSHSGINVNIQPLCDILKHKDVANHPVVIVSVNGPTRQGKSFFLNQVVKYLEYGNPANKKNWLDFSSEKLEHCWIYQDLLTCFDWSANPKSVTEGISIWPKPFYLFNKNSSKKLCVILMDNQGLGGRKSCNNEEYKLFALSNLISSLFIYFSKDSEGRHYLENLNEFSEFSTAVEFDGRTGKKEVPYKFGNLLIRFNDFSWEDFPLENGCCIYDKNNKAKRIKAQDFYEECFRSEPDEENMKKLRDQLFESFDEITLVTTSNYGKRKPNTLKPPRCEQDKGQKWDDEYIAGQIKLIENVFCYDFLKKSTKKIYGEETKAVQLIPLIQIYGKRILEPGYNIQSINNYQANVYSYFSELIEQSKEMYNEKFETYKEKSVNRHFQTFYEETRKYIFENLWKHCIFQKHRNEYWNRFQGQISKEVCVQMQLINSLREENRKTAKMVGTGCGVTGFVVLGAGAVASVFEATVFTALVTGGGGLLLVVPCVVYGAWKIKKVRESMAVKRIAGNYKDIS